MSTRTDEERVTRAPLLILLGGEPRPVIPLTIKKSRLWKQELAGLLGQLGGLEFTLSDDDGKFSMDGIRTAVETMAVAVPEKLEALVLSYLRASDPAISGEWFEETASDQEVTDALMRLIEATFPFLWKLGELAKVAQGLAR